MPVIPYYGGTTMSTVSISGVSSVSAANTGSARSGIDLTA
jgi:hypothetical protein